MTRGADGFLSRWSRLKREGDAPAERDAEPSPAAPEAEKTDAEILEDHGLPDPDDLAPGDDVSGFMAKAIPDRIRNRALRRLWLSNPALANLDELVDYGEDFTDAATVVENLASAWQAGRGYAPRPAPEATAETADAAAGPDAEVAPEPAEPDADPAGAPERSDEVETLATAEAPAQAPGPAVPPRRRRMAFTVPGDGDA